MKPFLIVFILSGILFIPLAAQDRPAKTDTVATIEEFKNLFRYQNYYLSAQPAYETLLWLKSRGVHVIINLRSEKENSDFAATAFNEETISREMGFDYHSLPVDGIKDYTPEKLNELAGLLPQHEPVLLHCAGAGRVSDFFMAYLVKYKGYTVNEAAEVGRKLKFSLPIEKLLDTKITLEAGK
jgi:protein tyrosine phosphatase (PTP) superfamily phosphohydrolase (DUF442 family)